MKTNIFYKRFLLMMLVVLTLPVVSYAQYTIPDNTKKDVHVKEVTIPTSISHDTTGLKLNTKAYHNFLKREERKAKNLFTLTNSLTTSQTGYRNWAAGGTSFLGLSFRSMMSHTYNSENKKFSTLTTWDLKYGMATKEYENEQGETKNKFTKNEDLILITNNINYKLHGKLFYDFNTSLNTQFANTYPTVTSKKASSKFFAPATVNIGLGLSYKLDNNRIITVSPVSGNLLFVLDDSLSSKGAYGVDEGKKLLPNVGMNIKLNWLQPIVKDKTSGETILSYKVLADMFYDYKEKPVFNWNNTINFAVFKFLTVNLAWTLKYDDRVEPQEDCKTHWQFNNVLSIGLAYTFNNRVKK